MAEAATDAVTGLIPGTWVEVDGVTSSGTIYNMGSSTLFYAQDSATPTLPVANPLKPEEGVIYTMTGTMKLWVKITSPNPLVIWSKAA